MSYLTEQLKEIKNLQTQIESDKWKRSISVAIDRSTRCLNKGNKLLFAGNGGSAADAQHMAGEFVSRFEFDRPGLNAIALTVDTSIITACGNDYGYEKIFYRQIMALAVPGDLIWLYTTSGKSKNIILAAEAAKKCKVDIIVFCGNYTAEFDKYTDCIISIDSNRTPRIQEWHLISGHLICGSIENKIFK